MAQYSVHRISGYLFTIVVHISNIISMANGLRPVENLPELKTFAKLQPRYFTCWNIGLQVIYSFIALLCEVLILKNSKNKRYKLNKHLKALRDILFSGIIWPCTLVVFSIFWSLFFLDRDLIFPKFADKALTPVSNHVIHTLIVPIVLWEVAFRPRIPPKSHKRNIGHLLLHLAVYLCVLAYTYMEHGIWIYPILTKLYGTVYFPIALLFIVTISILYYYLQWVVSSFMWGGDSKKTS
ncbi:androgen-dependent TFPI-regulating protein-like [Epargyreus clarus]|uniref:androgen-dependent TFPI-regulating protein-like n=1 Tax=Epargyreus clarus TaxID=520877 RepID=UPI003C2DAF8C